MGQRAKMFKGDAVEKEKFRAKLFKEVNKSGSGAVHFDEWLDWSYNHIVEKAKSLNEKDAVSKMQTNAEDFKKWIIAAARDRSSPEYEELHYYLMECFIECDLEDSVLHPRPTRRTRLMKSEL